MCGTCRACSCGFSRLASNDNGNNTSQVEDKFTALRRVDPSCDCLCGKNCICHWKFRFTRHEDVLFWVILIVEVCFWIWSIQRSNDSIYIDDIVYNSEYNATSTQSLLAKLAVFLRLIELQTILLWTLYHQKRKPLTGFILLRLISMVSLFLGGLTMIVLSINENLRTIARILIGISIVNVVVCLFTLILDITSYCTNNNDNNSNNYKHHNSTSKNRAKYKRSNTITIRFLLLVILCESVLTSIFLWLDNEDSKTMNRIFYDVIYSIDRIKILILMLPALWVTINCDWKKLDNNQQAKTSLEANPSSMVTTSRKGSGVLLSKSQSSDHQYGKMENDDSDQDIELAIRLDLNGKDGDKPKKKFNARQEFKEISAIKGEYSSWDSITTTVIGYTQIGKTMYIRALSKFEQNEAETLSVIMEDEKMYVIQTTFFCLFFVLISIFFVHNMFCTHCLVSCVFVCVRGDDSTVGIGGETDKYIDLETFFSSNRYNFIDYYCRWEQKLQTSFSFWDTIGYPANNFNMLALECLKNCDIGIFMYDLTKCIELENSQVSWWEKNDSLRYLQQLDLFVCGLLVHVPHQCFIVE